jgi:uroporphyrinogen-III synthase
LSGVTTPDCDLHGLGVLVTRPIEQAGLLGALIGENGGHPVIFPAVAIAPSRNAEKAVSLLRQPTDLIIFISPNAVNYALDLLGEPAFPQAARLAAVGGATARALTEAGYRVDLQPAERFDSEGLLALPELARLTGQRVVIVRGEGGRALLGDTLKARGAELVYAEVYRRVRPQTDPTELLRRWPQRVDMVTATSNEILCNLVALLGQAGWPLLSQTPMLVISERMREQAEDLGFKTTLVARNATNNAIVIRLCNWVQSGH